MRIAGELWIKQQPNQLSWEEVTAELCPLQPVEHVKGRGLRPQLLNL